MAKPKSKHLNIQLSDNEMDLLEQFTKGIYGAKNLLIRTLLRRFFKEQGLYNKPVLTNGGLDETSGVNGTN